MKDKYKISQHLMSVSAPSVWFRLLLDNGGVKSAFWGMTAKITMFSFLTYPFQLLDRLFYNRKVKSQDLAQTSPVFILGHWRSGTTHLQTLFCRDPQFGYLTNYQAYLFNIAAIGGKALKYIVSLKFPKVRPMDNMIFGVDEPAEDEYPLCNISQVSGYLGYCFPKNEDYFKKYVLFEDIANEEKEKWQSAYTSVLKRTSFLNQGKPLILKNPFHTARISQLLELFPNAKFVYIHRNPIDVFSSTKKWYAKSMSAQFLQKMTNEEIQKKIIYQFKGVMGRYFENVNKIPKENLIEIKFSDLENKPIEMMERIYSHLKIDGFDNAQPYMQSYLDHIGVYKKNQHSLTSEEIDLVKKEWSFAFEKGGYPIG